MKAKVLLLCALVGSPLWAQADAARNNPSSAKPISSGDIPLAAGERKLTPAEERALRTEQSTLVLDLIELRNEERRAARDSGRSDKDARAAARAERQSANRVSRELKIERLREIENQLRSGARAEGNGK
jgi:hypothetical protein